MQRLAFPTLLLTTFLAIPPASAGPLNLDPSAGQRPQSGIGTIFAAPAAPESVTPRPVAADGNFGGGGFLEMLFRPPGGQQYAPQRSYQPEPRYQTEPQRYQSEPQRYEPEPTIAPGFQPYSNGEGQSNWQEASAPVSPERQMNPRFLKQEVDYSGRERAGTVIINTRERHLYLVQGNGRAIRYGIGVGRPGFTWAGTHSITQMREWPSWRPPAEMLRRQPHLPRFMPGGPDNPLGARAMYLGSTLYRIHGSNEPWTIGTQVSSGCIRMRNEDVMDLYSRVHVGTRVVVL